MVQQLAGAAIVVAALLATPAQGHSADAATKPASAQAVKRLADEVRGKGWIVFSARSQKGDWDLFLCRPDGSALRNITRTPERHEAAPQFSRDGRKLLYRRLLRNETIDDNHYGTQGELVLANSDGTNAKAFGKSGEAVGILRGGTVWLSPYDGRTRS